MWSHSHCQQRPSRAVPHPLPDPRPRGGWKPGGWDMKSLAADLRRRGFKLGLYATAGFKAVYGYEDVWATVMFAEWGVESANIDHMCNVAACENAPGPLNQSGINKFVHQIVPYYQQATVERWAKAIAQVNRTNSVLFHNCDIGCAPAEGVASNQPRPWGDWCRRTANMWRTAVDINPISWRINLASLIGRGSYSGPGGWNYPDSLEVGNWHRGKKMPDVEGRAHFSLWCITSSPLYLGMRVANMTSADLATVSNARAIAINQAWAGYAGDMLNFSDQSVQPPNRTLSNYSVLPFQSVWWKPLPNQTAAAVLYNNGKAAATFGFRFEELQWRGVHALGHEGLQLACQIEDVWGSQTDMKTSAGGFQSTVPSGDIMFVRIHTCVKQ